MRYDDTLFVGILVATTMREQGKHIVEKLTLRIPFNKFANAVSLPARVIDNFQLSRYKRRSKIFWPLKDKSLAVAPCGKSFIASRIVSLPRTLSSSGLSFSSSLTRSRIGLFEIFVRLLINANVRTVDPRIKEFSESWCKILAKIESWRLLGLTNTTYSTVYKLSDALRTTRC